jgi:uncharacterized protein with ACT and thioredoxin-like domain
MVGGEDIAANVKRATRLFRAGVGAKADSVLGPNTAAVLALRIP